LRAIEATLGRVEHLLTVTVTGDHPRRNRAIDKAVQQLLRLRYRELATRGERVSFEDVELKFFSQNGEDGIILYLFSLIEPTTRRSVEICAGDGIECNTANLVVNHGWEALLVDGSKELLDRGRAFYTNGVDTWFYPPRLVDAWVTAESVNQLVTENGFAGEIDLLSLDMDGVDFWVWKALDCVNPKVVVAEFNPALGPDRSVAHPYDPSFSLQESIAAGAHQFYLGASLRAWTRLAALKGYRLVGIQRYGFNAFFVRNDLCTTLLPAVDPADLPVHPAAVLGIADFAPVVDSYDWVQI
jgi:hypothetical protein